MPVPHGVVEPGVIRNRAQAGFDEPCRKGIDFTARLAVDDAGLTAVAAEDVGQLLLQDAAREHAIDQIRSIERPNELHRLTKSELPNDVAAYALGCRRRKGVKADVRPPFAQLGELPVLRAEVVAPLADAMRLIDRDEADRPPADETRKTVTALAHETLGCDVQQTMAALAHAVERALLLF